MVVQTTQDTPGKDQHDTIALTAYAVQEGPDQYFALGMDDYIRSSCCLIGAKRARTALVTGSYPRQSPWCLLCSAASLTICCAVS